MQIPNKSPQNIFIINKTRHFAMISIRSTPFLLQRYHFKEIVHVPISDVPSRVPSNPLAYLTAFFLLLFTSYKFKSILKSWCSDFSALRLIQTMRSITHG